MAAVHSLLESSSLNIGVNEVLRDVYNFLPDGNEEADRLEAWEYDISTAGGIGQEFPYLPPRIPERVFGGRGSMRNSDGR